MDELMTRDEIEARFPSEWVLVADPQLDEQGEVVRGRVVFHSKSRDEIDRKDIELRPRSAAYLFTGRLPADAVVIL